MESKWCHEFIKEHRYSVAHEKYISELFWKLKTRSACDDADGIFGDGDSLNRDVAGDYGNDIDNWQAITPSPGTP